MTYQKGKAGTERRWDSLQVTQPVSGQEQEPAPTSLLRPLFPPRISSMCFNRQTVFVFVVTHSSCTAHPRDIGSSLPWPGRWVDNKEKMFRSPSPFQAGNSARLRHRESPGALRDFLTPCPTGAALPSGKASRQPALNPNWQAGNSARCLKKTQSEKGLKCAET